MLPVLPFSSTSPLVQLPKEKYPLFPPAFLNVLVICFISLRNQILYFLYFIIIAPKRLSRKFCLAKTGFCQLETESEDKSVNVSGHLIFEALGLLFKAYILPNGKTQDRRLWVKAGCFFFALVDWDRPHPQTALTDLNNFMSLNCIRGSWKRRLLVGVTRFIKGTFVWVDSTRSLGFIK